MWDPWNMLTMALDMLVFFVEMPQGHQELSGKSDENKSF